MGWKELFKMDFKPSLTLHCMLVMITIIDGYSGTNIPVTGVRGSSVTFPLRSQGLNDLAEITGPKFYCLQNNDTWSADICSRKMRIWEGSIELVNVMEEDEGLYIFDFGKRNETFFLEVFDPAQIPTVSIHCHPNGTTELVCKGDSSASDECKWIWDTVQPQPEPCIKDDGKRLVLERHENGKVVCQILKGKKTRKSSPIELICDNGDLLKHPWFFYIVAGSGGAAILLAAIFSAITCCYMRSNYKFIPVPSEEEKEEGMPLSATANKAAKCPPNNEASAAKADSPLHPEGRGACQSLESDLTMEGKPKAEAKSELDAEVAVDIENQEMESDSFPSPIDP
ncbi:PREDICTED: uncharacterized protein LOC109305671 [Crocodylus porosus]|uniref:uncharacterized protein LOC109305671 n=1 Tax=Crocodylus porosus TaxID=8502 RepID=UPI00093F00ED|nr:PREDICTED: uncharacterized protein LOC109305671 [Crocodylus porosus]